MSSPSPRADSPVVAAGDDVESLFYVIQLSRERRVRSYLIGREGHRMQYIQRKAGLKRAFVCFVTAPLGSASHAC
jgi:hypothetical protein